MSMDLMTRCTIIVDGQPYGLRSWPSVPRVFEHIEVRSNQEEAAVRVVRVLRVVWKLPDSVTDDRPKVDLICAWEPLGAPRPIEPIA